jgi:hypothetical protein
LHTEIDIDDMVFRKIIDANTIVGIFLKIKNSLVTIIESTVNTLGHGNDKWISSKPIGQHHHTHCLAEQIAALNTEIHDLLVETAAEVH